MDAVLPTAELLHRFSIVVSTDSKCCHWGCKMASIIKFGLSVLIVSLGMKIVSKQNESNNKINDLPYHSPLIVEFASSPLLSY